MKMPPPKWGHPAIEGIKLLRPDQYSRKAMDPMTATDPATQLPPDLLRSQTLEKGSPREWGRPPPPTPEEASISQFIDTPCRIAINYELSGGLRTWLQTAPGTGK